METRQQTSAYVQFWQQFRRNSDFVTLIMALVNRFIIMLETGTRPQLDLAVFAEGLDKNPEIRPLLEGIDSRLDAAWDSFVGNTTKEQWQRMVLEIHISRNVDAFFLYLIQVLTHVFTENATRLGERDAIRISQLEGEERDRAIERLADSLIGRGLRAVLGYLSDNMSFVFDTATTDFNLADEYIAVRNIHVHHGGHVDQRFLNRTQQTNLQIGDLFPLTVDYANNGAVNFMRIIGDFDAELIDQFNFFPTERSRLESVFSSESDGIRTGA